MGVSKLTNPLSKTFFSSFVIYKKTQEKDLVVNPPIVHLGNHFLRQSVLPLYQMDNLMHKLFEVMHYTIKVSYAFALTA